MWPFKRKNRRTEPTALEDERAIFRYWDGERERAVDPLDPWNRLWTDPEVKPEVDYPAWEQRNELETIQRLIPHVRRVFELKPFDEGGLTADEALRLLRRFLAYTQDIAKKNGQLPIPFRVWALKFSAPKSTTKPAAASSGTPNASSAAEPTGPTAPSAVPSPAA